MKGCKNAPEDMRIKGVPLNIYGHSQLETANIPVTVRDGAYEHISYLERKAAVEKRPAYDWPGFTVFYNYGKTHAIVLNDHHNSPKNKIWMESTKKHESTHVYLKRKCKSLDKDMEEGVALARGFFYYNRRGLNFKGPLDLEHYRNLNGCNPSRIKESMEEYYDIAEKIGDDAALDLARNSMNENGDALEIFKRKASDYKDNLMRVFNLMNNPGLVS